MGERRFFYRGMVKGYVYRWWSRFIHKHGYHYAPSNQWLCEYRPGTGTGIESVATTRHLHWCQWCGLRGHTLEIHLHES